MKKVKRKNCESSTYGLTSSRRSHSNDCAWVPPTSYRMYVCMYVCLLVCVMPRRSYFISWCSLRQLRLQAILHKAEKQHWELHLQTLPESEERYVQIESSMDKDTPVLESRVLVSESDGGIRHASLVVFSNKSHYRCFTG